MCFILKFNILSFDGGVKNTADSVNDLYHTPVNAIYVIGRYRMNSKRQLSPNLNHNLSITIIGELYHS